MKKTNLCIVMNMSSHLLGFSWLSVSPLVPIVHHFWQIFLCPYIAAVDKFYRVVEHLLVRMKGSVGKPSFIRSSLLLQQCPACLVRRIWMILEIGSRWPHSCYIMGCCFQDLFNTACSILMQLPSSCFSILLVSVHVVQPYNKIDTNASWKNLFYFIGLVWPPITCKLSVMKWALPKTSEPSALLCDWQQRNRKWRKIRQTWEGLFFLKKGII